MFDWYTLHKQNQWETLGKGRSYEMIEELNRHLAPIYIPPPFFRSVKQINLPFYRKYVLLRLDDLNVDRPAPKYVLYHEADEKNDTDVYMLDGSNSPIYAVNDKAPLQHNTKNVEDYIRFFFSFVRGRHGHFFYSNEDDINALEGSTSFKDEIRSRYIVSSTKEYLDRKYKTHALVVFKDALFETEHCQQNRHYRTD